MCRHQARRNTVDKRGAKRKELPSPKVISHQFSHGKQLVVLKRQNRQERPAFPFPSFPLIDLVPGPDNPPTCLPVASIPSLCCFQQLALRSFFQSFPSFHHFGRPLLWPHAVFFFCLPSFTIEPTASREQLWACFFYGAVALR